MPSECCQTDLSLVFQQSQRGLHCTQKTVVRLVIWYPLSNAHLTGLILSASSQILRRSLHIHILGSIPTRHLAHRCLGIMMRQLTGLQCKGGCASITRRRAKREPAGLRRAAKGRWRRGRASSKSPCSCRAFASPSCTGFRSDSIYLKRDMVKRWAIMVLNALNVGPGLEFRCISARGKSPGVRSSNKYGRSSNKF